MTVMSFSSHFPVLFQSSSIPLPGTASHHPVIIQSSSSHLPVIFQLSSSHLPAISLSSPCQSGRRQRSRSQEDFTAVSRRCRILRPVQLHLSDKVPSIYTSIPQHCFNPTTPTPPNPPESPIRPLPLKLHRTSKWSSLTIL